MGVKSNCFEAWKLTLNPFVESGSINIFCVCLVLYLKTFTRNNNRNRQNKNRLIDHRELKLDGAIGHFAETL